LTKSDPLDLYARIEPMIGFYEAYETLYACYLDQLHRYPVKTVLDIGCGNGTMLLKLQKRYEAKGIDLSKKMVEIARSKGANAHHQPLDAEKERYDAILAVADVLNYLDKPSLKKFLTVISQTLKPGGIFLFDINTLYGFEEVTAGSLIKEEEEAFLAIDARFENDRLFTDITLFEKEGKQWLRSQAHITQYYYDVADIMERSDLKLIGMEDITLFGDEPDKTLLILQKEKR